MADTKTTAGSAGATTELAETSLIDDILGETQLKPTDEGYDATRKGVQAFLTEQLTPEHAGEKIDRALCDALIAEIDAKITHQGNEILHDPDFQRL